ncbi:hypothetical protein N0V88_004420 [Collariella sp. IMI 366227]|nr:hypothetical protein N0V88_004420 [Collariella sp. IMI 366227]
MAFPPSSATNPSLVAAAEARDSADYAIAVPRPTISLTTVTDPSGRLDPSVFQNQPFRFDTGIALFAKRAAALSAALSLAAITLFHRPVEHPRPEQGFAPGRGGAGGLTSGDDAVFASERLWARLILHFWATALFEDAALQGEAYHPDPVRCLQRAYEQTIEATGPPNDWLGTTTAAGAQLHYRRREQQISKDNGSEQPPDLDDTTISPPPIEDINPEDKPSEDHILEPLLYVTNLGDSQIMVVRPSTRELVYKSAEQWHWFDCPRQLGTNSPDTPRECAVVDAVPIQEGDVVLAMSDGVIDNLWSHEIVEAELMEAAKAIAVDPFAESPFMEHAIEEGLASGGGKMDDISVVAAICRRNERWTPGTGEA